ncbi:hypothetical protein Tco_1156291 [Tanacetum coccineum]
MESLNYNSQERELLQLQQMQDKAKESCMASFRLLHSLLQYFIAYTRTDVQQFRDTLIQHMAVKKSIDESAQHKREYDRRVNDRKMQTKEGKVDSSKALDAGLVVTESNGTESEKHVTSSKSGNDTHAEDADIKPVNNKEPMAEVQMTAEYNVLSNGQQHAEQPEFKNEGRVDQVAKQYQVKSPLLGDELLKTNDMVEKEVYNELSNRFLQLEKHCLSLEISIQQKEECFQSNKPCKNQDAPEFRAFFKINELKAQLQAKTTLISNLKKQIKNLHEASNEAKVKNDIDVIETINIELEHSVAKLLVENEQLHKENEHLKQTYKEIYDSIKKTRVQNKYNSDSLISQINQKSIKNADLKAQIQDKVFANATLKNKLRKLKGNSVDTKFAKASILGELPLQPSKNHSVVRKPNAFKWVPTGKIFTSTTTKVGRKPTHGSNEDITNLYECEQTLNVSESTLNLSAGPGLQFMTPGTLSSGLVPNPPSSTPCVPPTKNDWDILFQPMFDELSNPSPSVVSPVPAIAAQRPADPTGSPMSTSIDQDAPSSSNPSTQEQEQYPIISQGVEESPKTPHFHDDPLHETFHKDSTSQGSSSNVRPSHTLLDLLGKWTKIIH